MIVKLKCKVLGIFDWFSCSLVANAGCHKGGSIGEKVQVSEQKLYNLLPTFAFPNAERGDTPYGPGGFMPPNEVRGQIARAIFYFATTYYDRIEGAGQYFFLGMIPVLMEWNRSFPPNEVETRRNDLVSGFQGNRNPYIDNPDLVDRVGESAWSNIFR